MIDNLKDAIAHAREKAEEQKKKAESNIIETTKEGWIRVYDGKEYNACLECAKNHLQLASWLEELAKRRETDRWIPVSERLPEKNGNYLVLLNNGEMTTDIFYEEELFMGFWGYMTHWRPLPPKPYERENDNG